MKLIIILEVSARIRTYFKNLRLSTTALPGSAK